MSPSDRVKRPEPEGDDFEDNLPPREILERLMRLQSEGLNLDDPEFLKAAREVFGKMRPEDGRQA
ncbi:MAG: hypothetical protein FJ206_00025 [Gemmatimonadetes bacterium]|nr:hypothetical protein [Gemmatimonadota bacterium]